MKRQIVVAISALVNAKSRSNMLYKGKVGGSILTTSFGTFFFKKLHSLNYTLPRLIKRRNRGVIFFIFTIFSVVFGENPRPGNRLK